MSARLPRNTVPRCGECGWVGKGPMTEGTAAYALSRHSCDKQRRLDASAERGRARRAAVDRTPKPCLHKRTAHRHGTYACYVLDRCKCRPCAKAASDYERHRYRQRAYGRAAYVDAEPTRAHLRELATAGVGLKRIKAISGVSSGVLNKLLYGCPRPDGTRRPPAKRIRWETAVRLQAVRPTFDALAGGARVDPTGTRRRVQALVAVGWSLSKIGERLGMTRGNFGHTLEAGTITARTARAVRELYDELWDQLPPRTQWQDKSAYTRAIKHAQARGWAPPMAWDDEGIDDPAARPWGGETSAVAADLDEVLVDRFMAGNGGNPLDGSRRLTPESREAIYRLADHGATGAEIERVVGLGKGSAHNVLSSRRIEQENAAEQAETDRTIDVIAGCCAQRAEQPPNRAGERPHRMTDFDDAQDRDGSCE